MQIKGLVFDFDGLILDTEGPSYRSWEEIFVSYQTSLPLSEWNSCIGSSFDAFDPFTYLKTKVNCPLDEKEIRARALQRSIELVKSKQPLPGVLNMINEAHQHGIKTALASSSDRAWINMLINHLNLSHDFEIILTADDVSQVKPDPELYSRAVQELDILPEEAIAFEDSPNGAKAAKSAGLYCVVIPNQMTKSLFFEETDLTISSLSLYSLKEIIHKVTQNGHFID
jgi:HAD superfamily hydrolase (TIGR01509 family)